MFIVCCLYKKRLIVDWIFVVTFETLNYVALCLKNCFLVPGSVA